MKRILTSVFLASSLGFSFAQSDITINGHLDNTSGSPIAVDLEIDDLGTMINQSVTTDAAGDFSTIVTVSAGATQGAIVMSFTDCNGAAQSQTSGWFPSGLVVDFSAVDYCPAVPPACNAEFSVAQEYVGNVAVPNSLLLSDLSTGSNLSYSWDMGDGTTLSGASISHTYSAPGPFNLCLTIDDGNGCVSTFCDSIGVNASGLMLAKQGGFTINIPGGQTAGIEEAAASYLFNLYPNPAVGNVKMELGSLSEAADLRLINVSGQVVLAQTIEAVSTNQVVEIDLNNVPSGVYMVRLVTQHGAHNQRLIVK